MKFYCVRHAVAMDRENFKKANSKSDFYRPLTEKGRDKFAKQIKKLQKKKIKISQIYTSPYLRCLQTAKMLSVAFNIKAPQTLKALAHQESKRVSSQKMLLKLKKLKKNSLFVGHEPELSCLMQELIPEQKALPFKKGEFRCIKKAKSKEHYKVLWTLRPSRKRRIPE